MSRDPTIATAHYYLLPLGYGPVFGGTAFDGNGGVRVLSSLQPKEDERNVAAYRFPYHLVFPLSLSISRILSIVQSTFRDKSFLTRIIFALPCQQSLRHSLTST